MWHVEHRGPPERIGAGARSGLDSHQVPRALGHLQGDREVENGEALEGDVGAADLHLAEPGGEALRELLAVLGAAGVQRQVPLLLVRNSQ